MKLWLAAVSSRSAGPTSSCDSTTAVRSTFSDMAARILIDLGNGAALDHLKSARVDTRRGRVLHSRPQGPVSGSRAGRGAWNPSAVSRSRQVLVDQELRSDFRPPSPLVGTYSARFEPPHPIPGARFDVSPWQPCPMAGGELEVLAAPGHAAGPGRLPRGPGRHARGTLRGRAALTRQDPRAVPPRDGPLHGRRLPPGRG